MSDLFPEDPSLSLFSSRFLDQGFDPTAIRPIVSPSQTRPRHRPSIESALPDIDQVIQQATQGSQNVISPKRPLPLDDSDNENGRALKFQRAASPLKGAAGRKLDQQKRSQLSVDPPLFPTPQHVAPPHPLPPPPLPRDVTFLLSIIPGADKYTATRFKPSELVSLPLSSRRPFHPLTPAIIRSASSARSTSQRTSTNYPNKALQEEDHQRIHLNCSIICRSLIYFTILLSCIKDRPCHLCLHHPQCSIVSTANQLANLAVSISHKASISVLVW